MAVARAAAPPVQLGARHAPARTRCATVQELCALPTCPETIDELAGSNWIQVGCGVRMMATFSGTSNAQTYYFDAATGELLGGVRYSDSQWGPCSSFGVIFYSFGEDLGSPTGGLDCSDVMECGKYPDATPLSDCLPGAAGAAGNGGGQGGDGGT
jgi:hypothetical protein